MDAVKLKSYCQQFLDDHTDYVINISDPNERYSIKAEISKGNFDRAVFEFTGIFRDEAAKLPTECSDRNEVLRCADRAFIQVRLFAKDVVAKAFSSQIYEKGSKEQEDCFFMMVGSLKTCFEYLGTLYDYRRFLISPPSAQSQGLPAPKDYNAEIISKLDEVLSLLKARM